MSAGNEYRAVLKAPEAFRGKETVGGVKTGQVEAGE